MSTVLSFRPKAAPQRSLFQPPLDGNLLRVHTMNSDPSSALHGEPAPRQRTSWLAVSIVLVGIVVLAISWARYLLPWMLR